MTTQDAFRAALLDPEASPPQTLVAPGGRPAGRRFDVYRNTVSVGLTEALETGFPVVRRLVGTRFFKAMAGVFLRAHPPTSPILSVYGDALPGFLERFPPVSALPYLPDVARLELALRRAYHAADAAPLSSKAFDAVPSERLTNGRLTLAPAVCVLRSRYPLHTIWHANAAGGPGSVTDASPECVLVSRPIFDPMADALRAPEAAFVQACLDGATIEAAIARSGAQLDLPRILGLLLARQAITSLQEGSAA